MNILLISTTIVDDTSGIKLERLRNSLINDSGIRFFHAFLFQNTQKVPKELAEFFGEEDLLLATSEIMSLSKARNFLIRQVLQTRDIDEFSFVAYPDDDAWYTRGTIDYLNYISNKNIAIELFISKYSSTPSDFENSLVEDLTVSKLVKNASSNTIFVSKRVFIELGFFDELLGIGAKYNGGEDLDYALRAYLLSDTSLYCDVELIGHRDKDRKISYKYFLGSYIALKRSCGYLGLEVFYQFFRKFLIGVYYIFSKKLSFIVFLELHKNGNKSQ